MMHLYLFLKVFKILSEWMFLHLYSNTILKVFLTKLAPNKLVNCNKKKSQKKKNAWDPCRFGPLSYIF